MDWHRAKEVAETVESILKSAGLMVAAAWAYWRFFLQAERETSISSKMQVTVLPCEETGFRLLEVRSTLTNGGKVPCEIDLSRSTLRVDSLYLKDSGVSCDTKPFYKKDLGGEALNVPVGSSSDRVQFVPVRHPGIYFVETFFSQTERDMRILYKRLGRRAPKNLGDRRIGWFNAAVISTHAASLEEAKASIPANRADTPHSV